MSDPLPDGALNEFEDRLVREQMTSLSHALGADALVIVVVRQGCVLAQPGGRSKKISEDICRRLRESFIADGVRAIHLDPEVGSEQGGVEPDQKGGAGGEPPPRHG